MHRGDYEHIAYGYTRQHLRCRSEKELEGVSIFTALTALGGIVVLADGVPPRPVELAILFAQPNFVVASGFPDLVGEVVAVTNRACDKEPLVASPNCVESVLANGVGGRQNLVCWTQRLLLRFRSDDDFDVNWPVALIRKITENRELQVFGRRLPRIDKPHLEIEILLAAIRAGLPINVLGVDIWPQLSASGGAGDTIGLNSKSQRDGDGD